MTEHFENEKPIDLTKLLGRGYTPLNIEVQCLHLCQQYLGGLWLNLSIDDIEVQRLRGGLTNQLYFCAINENKQISGTEEPQEVVVLYYFDKTFNNLENIWSKMRLKDTIVALLVSENGLGPKIYSLMESGQIMKYYKHKNFRSEEQKDMTLIERVAQRLARIHAMDVPIKKTDNWLFHYFDDTYRESNQRFDLKTMFETTNSQTLKTQDISRELEWLKKAIIDCNSPNIFTHMDFRGSNIMITESDDIIICDFELSGYGYRGFDFGTISCEWGRTWGQWEDPHHFPNKETLKIFINSYIDEMVKLNGKQFLNDKRNSFNNILKELKIFTLVGFMWILLYLLYKNEGIIPEIPFNKNDLIETSEKVYKNAYFRCKQTLLAQNVVQENYI